MEVSERCIPGWARASTAMVQDLCAPWRRTGVMDRRVKNQIPKDILLPTFLDTGAYCFWNAYKGAGVLHVLDQRIADLPEWQPVLPKNDYRLNGQIQHFENGQKKLFPDLPISAAGPNGTSNFYLAWGNVLELQSIPISFQIS